MNDEINRILDELKEIRNDIRRIDERINRLNDEITSLKERVSKIETIINYLKLPETWNKEKVITWLVRVIIIILLASLGIKVNTI